MSIAGNHMNPTRIKALTGTLAVHLLLFLFFLLYRYTLPVSPLYEELGMEVNLGTDIDGSGEDQPMSIGLPAPTNREGASSSEKAEAAAQKSLLTDDDPDAPDISSGSTAGTAMNAPGRSRSAPSQGASPEPAPQPRYVYEGRQGTASGNQANENRPGSSEGNTSGHGDRGVPGGTPGATNYTGSPGNGTGGIAHNLSGRSISPNRFTAEFNEGGKVVVRVTVNRDGEIVSKQIKSSPSPTLSNIALQKLSQAKFSVSKDAAPQQFGEITIVFKTRS